MFQEKSKSKGKKKTNKVKKIREDSKEPSLSEDIFHEQRQLGKDTQAESQMMTLQKMLHDKERELSETSGQLNKCESTIPCASNELEEGQDGFKEKPISLPSKEGKMVTVSAILQGMEPAQHVVKKECCDHTKPEKGNSDLFIQQYENVK